MIGGKVADTGLPNNRNDCVSKDSHQFKIEMAPRLGNDMHEAEESQS